jgi:DNA-binding transcriptional MerR regulator
VSAREPDHLSIGEVLAELNDEFPDITISKIRFLESQGLVNPERTPSGYRKFFPHDLARLRWILYQQKEHFLPLKVIKERLDELPPGEEARLLDPAPATATGATEPDASAAERAEAGTIAARPVTAAAAPPRRQAAGRRAPAFAPTLPTDEFEAENDVVGAPDADTQHSRGELVAAAGIDDAQLSELEGYGLVAPSREVDGVAQYDDDALDVARIAAGFFRRGIEARHLRMYRTSAEREAVLFGQVLMPFVRQRNPEARGRLQEELVELSTLGRRLRTAMLRDAVRETLAE